MKHTQTNGPSSYPLGDFEIKLAQRIMCSAISLQMGISYQHCWKTYIEPMLEEGGKIGELYLEAAKYVRIGLQQSHQGRFSGSIT